jgi:hypothetical protein
VQGAGRRPGQVFGEQQVPHQQLQQHRDVAEGLHIAVAQRAHQGVAREAAHAQQGAQDGSQHDADHRHAQRVDQPDQEGLPVGVYGVVVEPAFADVEAGRLHQEVEAALDAAGLHVGMVLLTSSQTRKTIRLTASTW